MPISSESAKEIARIGVDMELTASCGYSSDSVKEIVEIVKNNGKHIVVHAGSLSSDSLKDIARMGGAHVTIAI